MLKVFRRIRKNLIKKNRTKDYLLYAVGEIVLVVIGILIALAINNWNQESIAQDRNAQILDKLVDDLDLNIDRVHLLDTVFNGTTPIFKFTDSVLNIVKRGITRSDLDYMTSRIIFEYNVFNLHSSTYEEMKNTGSLYSIGSDSLIKAIQLYYRLCDRDEFYSRTRGDLVNEVGLSCMPGWKNFRVLYNLDPNDAVARNPWIYDVHSSHYASLRLFLIEAANESRLGAIRLNRIAIHSENLKKLIQSEQKNKR